MESLGWKALAREQPQDVECSYRYEYQLPGILCPVCGPWSSTGWAYPTARTSALGDEFRGIRHVPVEQFAALRDMAEELVPPGSVLMPGTALGPARLRVEGPAPDALVWMSWVLFVRESVFQRLQRLTGGAVRGAPTTELPDWYEVEIPGGKAARPSSFLRPEQAPCAVCGRDGRRLRQPLEFGAMDLLEDSTPPIFRAINAPTTLVVSPRVVGVLQDAGATFKPLRVTGAESA